MKKLILPLLCATLLVACNQSQNVHTAQAASAVTVQEQTNLPSYRVISYPYTPFVIRGDNGEIAGGLETEILRAIEKKQNIHFEFVPPMANWDALFDNMKSKQADLLSAGMYSNPERHQQFEISKTYMNTQFALLSKKGSKINELSDLKNKKVAVMPTSIAEKEILQLPYANSITIIPMTSVYEGVTDVINGKADVLYTDQAVLTYYAHQFKDQGLVVNADPHAEPHQFVFLIAKGNTELLEKVNKGLAEIEADGTLNKIKDKWFK